MNADWRHGSEQPWGWHLRTAERNGTLHFLDEAGRAYPSIRDLFWQSRLGMSNYNPRIQNEQLELMLAALASLSRDMVGMNESIHTLFADNDRYYRFYNYWLHAEGLLQSHTVDPLGATLSDEGAAVLKMLAATRPLALAAIPIGPAAVADFGPPKTGSECDRAKFEALEGKAKRLPFAFVREELFHEPSISLLHRDMRDPIPVARTLWTMPFLDEVSRDRMYLWMHGRLDRWTAWGEVAKDNGAPALTQALLALLMLEPGCAGDASAGVVPVITYRP